MDKLIKLLNEYDKINEYINKRFRNEYGCLDREFGWATVESSCLKVISKDYGFIKRLVDNDKIDRKKVNFWDEIMYTVYEFYPEINKEQELLMLLSIQDEPIEFLISILK